MCLLRKSLGLSAVLVASLVRARQIAPFHVSTIHDRLSNHQAAGWNLEKEWDFERKPNPNATDHLIFDTVNTLLQHWTHTRYRNGHNIVPGVIPVGTLLYHGTRVPIIPRFPGWTATDPEHSYLFCCMRQDGNGCWHLTLVTTRPPKVLYFDGSSAAKMKLGSMDSQDLLVWGESRPDWAFEEIKRIDDLCAWGRKYALDGYLRMEQDFEVMLCDFSSGTEVVSFVKHSHLDDSHGAYRAIEAGKWHDTHPGETRVQLDYSRILSFYDTNLFPSLQVSRFGQERWLHRLVEMSPQEIATILGHADCLLTQGPGSGVDWKALYRVVYDRYFDSLDILRYIFNTPPTDEEADALALVKEALRQVKAVMAPYTLVTAIPRREFDGPLLPDHPWAVPIFEHCATNHIKFIDSPAFSQKLTSSEKLLLNTAKGVLKEICRVLVGIFAQGCERGIMEGRPAPVAFRDEASMADLVSSWRASIEGLMEWLDWSAWQKCDPACIFEELCYLPTWPYFNEGGEHFPLDPPLKPSPRCIRRIERFDLR